MNGHEFSTARAPVRSESEKKAAETVKGAAAQTSETEFLRAMIPTPHVAATRHSSTTALKTSNPMAEQRKQERDFTSDVDAVIPEARELAKVCLNKPRGGRNL
jgi:hypothetical protein